MFLLNASPDVREQLRRLPFSGAPTTVRHVPIEGVLLTDAEIDHSIGIVLLREGKYLPLYATAAIQSVLDRDSGFCQWRARSPTYRAANCRSTD